MDSQSIKDRLFRDRLQKLSDNLVPGIIASCMNAVILAVVCRNVVETLPLILWVCGIFTIGLVRLYLSYSYKKSEKNSRQLRLFRSFFLLTLAITGLVWGSAVLIIFPPGQIGYQLFITFVLGGMVAGSVGIYATMMDAFIIFSVPTLFPIIIRFYLTGEQIHLAMGTMILLFWSIMFITALKFNRDIGDYLMAKYENLDLISELEAEVKVREAAEHDLKQKNLEIEAIVDERTTELLEANKKLINEIEERRQISVALRENQEKYRDLVEHINDVIYSADKEGTLTYVSPVIRSVLGYEPEELMGKNIRDYVYKDDLEMVSAVLPQRLAGNTAPIEYRFRTKKNGYRWVRSSSRVVYNDGAFIAIRGAITDVSEKRKLEEQLRRSHKMEAIGTLTGGIAHDFNNLLAVILGNSELALFDLPNGHPVRGNLDRIMTTTLRAKRIVKELLSFSSSTGTERSPIIVGEVIRDELEHLRSSIPVGIELETDIAGDTEMILGDPVQIPQVMKNLCDNALDAMSHTGGVLTIGVKNISLSESDVDFDPDLAADRYVQVKVQDTGVGIATNDIRRIFDPYYTTKEVGKGDGLGLAVVHGIVKRHGGAVRVTSTFGEGACFEVFFPVCDVSQVS